MVLLKEIPGIVVLQNCRCLVKRSGKERRKLGNSKKGWKYRVKEKEKKTQITLRRMLYLCIKLILIRAFHFISSSSKKLFGLTR